MNRVQKKQLKKKYRRVSCDIRNILIRDWDPIGGGIDIELPWDEYDSCIGPIASLLFRDRSVQEIEELLQRIEKEYLECRTSSITIQRVAAKLKKIHME